MKILCGAWTAQFPRMDALGINYRLPDLPGLLNDYAFTTADSLTIAAPAENVDSPLYDGWIAAHRPFAGHCPSPLIIDKDALVRVEAFSPAGRT